MDIQEQVPLAPLTTIGVGGSARFFVEAKCQDDVLEAVNYARQQRARLFVLGGGSNLLVSDSGFSGMVLKLAILGTSTVDLDDGRVVLTVGAGEDWDDLVRFSVQQDYAGIECLSGIPGTVGGTPVQNVGAYGQEVLETIQQVEAFDTCTGQIRNFSNHDCAFSYRTSRFNTTERDRYIILRVTFALHPHGLPKLAYADLRKHLAETKNPSLADVRETVLQIRRSKGMLLDACDPDSRSAGSFFKNPVLSDAQFRELEKRAQERGLRVPNYPALSSQRKISAAWLVEQAGFDRGTVRGRVGLSSKHSLAIINRGGATAADVVALMREIQQAVAEQFGIALQPEPVFLGFD